MSSSLHRGAIAVLAAALLTGGALAKARPSQRAGYIPNAFVDATIDEPLAKAESIFDVYQVMVNHLKGVYGPDTEAMQAILKFDEFIAKYRSMDPDGEFRGEGDKTVEMPMNIDQFMALLRKDAPGVGGRPFAGDTRDNWKAQVYTAALLPFLQGRGITYRLRPLVERSFVAHTAAINGLRAIKNELTANGGKNALALFKFLTYPMAQKGRSTIQWHQPSELQQWTEQHFIPTLDASIAIAEHAMKNMPAGAMASVDFTVFLNADNPFPDASMETAYRTAGEPEMQNLLASLYGARAGAHLMCAYNWDDISDATNKFAKVHLNNFIREKVPFGKRPRIGTPSEIRYKIYSSYADLGTLRSAEHTQAALADARTGWDYYDKAMAGYFQAQEDDTRMVRLQWVHASYKDYETRIAPQIRAVLAGPATITDYVGGNTIDIDLAGMFQSPPQDLKGFFPTHFAKVKPYREFEFSSGRLAYSNYDFGNPTGWDESGPWKKLFPNLTDERGPEGHWVGPMKAYRDIQRTYIGPFLTPLMASVID